MICFIFILQQIDRFQNTDLFLPPCSGSLGAVVVAVVQPPFICCRDERVADVEEGGPLSLAIRPTLEHHVAEVGRTALRALHDVTLFDVVEHLEMRKKKG